MKRVFAILSLLILGNWVFSMDDLKGARNYLSEIEKEINTSLESWSYSREGKQWKGYEPGSYLGMQKFYLRTGFRFKKVLAGVRVEGSEAQLNLELRVRGLVRISVFLDGKKLKSFTVNAGDGTPLSRAISVPLGKSDGSSHQLVLEVFNEGFLPPRGNYWPPRKELPPEEGIYFSLRKAEVFYPEAQEELRIVRDWIDSMKVAYLLLNPVLLRYTFTGKPYKIKDLRRVDRKKIRRLNRQWVKAVMSFNLGAMRRGDSSALLSSIERSYRISEELSRYARTFQLFIVGNAHIDVAWLWRIYETMRVARNTFYTVIKNMAEYPELRYAQSSAIMYQWMEEYFPEVFEAIREKVKEGKWEIVGGMWLEPDCNLISGESWVRQILYGKRYFRDKFGVDVKVGWNIDSFGYNWNMPQIYRKSGIDYFVTQKIWWNDTTVFPYYVFWWEGVDGTRILSYFPPVGYTSRLRLIETVKALSTYEATTGYKKALILYGMGDHGGGPNREILNRVRHYAELKISPQFIHSTSMDFLKNIERDLGNSIPVWRDELYLEYHRGTYTTHSEIKKNNRRSEAMLSTTEKLASLAYLFGKDYPSADFLRAWKLVMTNQFHDILPGSGITSIYRDAMEFYRRAFKILGRIKSSSARYLFSRVNTEVKGLPLVVFNPLSWERKDYVKAKLPRELQGKFLVLRDPRGKVHPCEVFQEEGELYLGFIAEVPALGYVVYSLEEGKNHLATNLRARDYVLENAYYRVKVNPRTGNISSLYYKRLGKEFIPSGREGNLLQVWEDIPERWDAWNIGYTGRMWEINRADSVKLIHLSPVRAVIRVKKSFLGLSKSRYSPTEDFPSSFFVQDITLYAGLDRVDIKMKADWWENHMFLKVAFPVSVRSERAAYEIPFAAIERTTKMQTPWEKARFEVPAHRWADLSDGKAGISLLNDSKYGYDIHGNVMKLSLLRSPLWPDPTADRGKHSFTYSLYAHPGTWAQSHTVERGYELNQPLLAFLVGKHPGKLPRRFSFFSLSSSGIILDTVKKAEDDGALVLRLYESKGKPEEVVLTLYKIPRGVWETNLMEENPVPLGFKGREVPLKFKKFEIKTLKIKF